LNFEPDPVIIELFISQQGKKYFVLLTFINKLAEVPGAARVNLHPAEHLKNVTFSF